jgi:hypothetical protein
MNLPAGAVTGAIIGVLCTAALLFVVPDGGGKSDQMKSVPVKPIAMVPAPAPEPSPIASPAPEAPPPAVAPLPSSEPPPAKPNLHPRPHDKSLPVKSPPALPPQPPPVAAPPAERKPAAAAAKPSAWQCFKLRQEANGMTAAEQQDYAAKYLTPAQREAAKACGLK